MTIRKTAFAIALLAGVSSLAFALQPAVVLAPPATVAAPPAAVSAAPAPNTVSLRAAAQSLTIYFNGAVVQEERTFQCVAGSNNIQLQGVSAQYRPQTLMIESVTGPGKLTVNSVSYQAPNVSDAAVLAKSIGKQVQVDSLTGTLLSADSGTLVIQENGPGGALRIVRNADNVTVQNAPSGLSPTASLTLSADCEQAGTYTVKILYQTDGLSWHPTHSVVFDDASNLLKSFDSSVGIDNSSGTTYKDVTVSLIAGILTGAPSPRADGPAPMAAMAPGARSASVQSVGEQKMYTVPVKISLAPGENKQIPLLESSNVPVKKQYTYEPNGAPGKQPVSLTLSSVNDTQHNLGKPLPSGDARIYQRDASTALQLTNTSRLTSVAAGEAFHLPVGPATDVKGERTFVTSQDVKDGSGKVVARVETYRVTLYNYKTSQVPVQVKVYHGDGAQVQKSSVGSFTSDHGYLVNNVYVPANGSLTVEYTVRITLN